MNEFWKTYDIYPTESPVNKERFGKPRMTEKPKYELVRADGEISPMKFDTAAQAVEAAGYLWPGQPQDPERTGNGWSVREVGDV